MQLVDTHSHIYLGQFDADRDQVIACAVEKGVHKILLPNIDSTSIEPLNRLVGAYPDVCFPLMGLHPTSVKENYTDDFAIILKELASGAYTGIGEIGIDLYWDKKWLREQCLVFEQQLDLALEMNKPVVIHARASFEEIFEILKKYEGTSLKGVFHAFSGRLSRPGMSLKEVSSSVSEGWLRTRIRDSTRW